MANATTAEERLDWQTYRQTEDLEVRNRLVERHIRLVHHFAGRVRERTGGLAERGDLVSAGMVGLLAAVETYDPDRGYRFSTFAASRIRGAMLDELRGRDVAPRSVRRRQRAMEAASDRLAVSPDGRPAHGELARVLGVDVQTLWRWKWDVSRSRHVSLTDLLSPGLGPAATAGACSTVDDVEERLTRDAEVRRLHRELDGLSERDRLVIELYDMKSWTLRRIAARLAVTESRVSQIRTAALGRLRARMSDLREAA